MHIIKIISQHRRDFTAWFQCEHCKHEEQQTGYDDIHFHHCVVPAMKCQKCGKVAGKSYRPLATKYDDSEQV